MICTTPSSFRYTFENSDNVELVLPPSFFVSRVLLRILEYSAGSAGGDLRRNFWHKVKLARVHKV